MQQWQELVDTIPGASFQHAMAPWIGGYEFTTEVAQKEYLKPLLELYYDIAMQLLDVDVTNFIDKPNNLKVRVQKQINELVRDWFKVVENIDHRRHQQNHLDSTS